MAVGFGVVFLLSGNVSKSYLFGKFSRPNRTRFLFWRVQGTVYLSFTPIKIIIYTAPGTPGEEDDDAFFENRKARMVTIGHDVWVGHGATILSGVTIGNGAIIGAGSVVTHDVEPYTIVAGIPEKEIRTRFSGKISEGLEKSAWWDWDHDTLKARIDDFRDVNRFVTLYGDT